MADVYAIFGTLIALGIAYPGLLTAWRLLFPKAVARAQQRLAGAGWAAFWVGTAAAVPVILMSVVLISAPGGLLKFSGLVIAVLGLATASLGASGLAASMGAQLNEITGGKYSIAGAHLRGAVALELAAIFPLIGWLLILPVSTLVCFGAGVQSLAVRKPRTAGAGLQAAEA